MSHAIFTALTLAAFVLFLSWAGDNLGGPSVQPLDGLINAADLIESKPSFGERSENPENPSPERRHLVSSH
mgnify:CR=1 FL=1